MKFSAKTAAVTALFALSLSTGCKKKSSGFTAPIDTVTVKKPPVLTLPQREAKVYIGISNRWHDLTNTANNDKWSFVRANADGYYTNFIAMWINFYQNSEDPQKSCNDMAAAFTKKGVFFETSLETKVNDDAVGGNNETTDKKYIDMLLQAGFTVDHTSLNYGIDAQRVNTLRTYKGTRTCLTLAGPWLVGGNIGENVNDNLKIRANISATDGMQTDGPLGFWFNNASGMREGSYSLVKYTQLNKKIAAVMLSPFDADVPGYNQSADFLNISKKCVLDHEDNNASPDLWTIWTYGEHNDQPTFPESAVNAAGETEAANTLSGVGYWLLKHLRNLPKLEIKETGNVNNNVSVTLNNTDAEAVIKGGTGGGTYTMPVSISNDLQPQIEISPVIHAVLGGAAADWEVAFKIADKDVTNDAVYNGGINCIKNLRLSKTNKLTLNITMTAKKSAAAPLTIKLETMSNVSNTKQVTVPYTITAKLQ